jgi:starvation-inducible DNA-binding protein
MNLNRIGLDIEKSNTLAERLNVLLATYSMFYINTRGYHWNIRGQKFFELHLKFEELYTDIFTKIDEVAERIVTLGHTPLHTYQDYLEHSAIKPEKNVITAESTVNGVLNSLQGLIKMQRSILELADELNDEGTNALMSDYIREQEKLVWMYSAFLG